MASGLRQCSRTVRLTSNIPKELALPIQNCSILMSATRGIVEKKDSGGHSGKFSVLLGRSIRGPRGPPNLHPLLKLLIIRIYPTIFSIALTMSQSISESNLRANIILEFLMQSKSAIPNTRGDSPSPQSISRIIDSSL